MGKHDSVGQRIGVYILFSYFPLTSTHSTRIFVFPFSTIFIVSIFVCFIKTEMGGTGMMEYKGGTGSGHYLSWNLHQSCVVCELLNVNNI